MRYEYSENKHTSKTIILTTRYRIFPHLRSSTGQKRLAQKGQPQQWDDSKTPTVRVFQRVYLVVSHIGWGDPARQKCFRLKHATPSRVTLGTHINKPERRVGSWGGGYRSTAPGSPFSVRIISD